jgi:sugar phosphate isomerase/epimerase
MKISFSTLGCPDWTLRQVIDLARRERYDGVELRFIEGDAALWKRAEFTGAGLRDALAVIRNAALVVSCVDTSCFFHSPDPAERRRMLDEGRRMLALAAALGAPGIRIFGDRVQPGATREATEGWIAEGFRVLGEEAAASGLETWLETHGDFASAAATAAILRRSATRGAGLVWDPANAFAEAGEQPADGYVKLAGLVRHVHLKDLRRGPQSDAENPASAWKPVLTGTGQFPADRVVALLGAAGFAGHVSFEWEKRWHPTIEEPEVALPHFASWFRQTLAGAG